MVLESPPYGSGQSKYTIRKFVSRGCSENCNAKKIYLKKQKFGAQKFEGWYYIAYYFLDSAKFGELFSSQTH